MVSKFLTALLGVILVAELSFAQAHSQPQAQAQISGDPVEQALKQELSKRYLGARVELSGPIRWLKGSAPEDPEKVSIISENARGEIRFGMTGTGSDMLAYSEGVVAITAMVPAWVASRRVYPGEKLSNGTFQVQDVNVAASPAREYRGVMVSPAEVREKDLRSLESRQTILEGLFLMSTAVQKVPDVRRGDAVTILIESGGLKLSTAGIAQEAAYLNGPVRVLTQKSKRELLGSLKSSGEVEVRL